jgi:hypothetical protein
MKMLLIYKTNNPKRCLNLAPQMYCPLAKRSPLGSRNRKRVDLTAHAHSASSYSKHIVLQLSPAVQCIVYANSVARVNACFVKDYSVAVHAHPTPNGLLMAREQYVCTE